MNRIRHYPIPMLAAASLCLLVGWTVWSPLAHSRTADLATARLQRKVFPELGGAIEQVNRLFESRWSAEGLDPAGPAQEHQVLRRLTLALFGTIPSLEEVRAFEADRDSQRLERWTLRLLADRRFADYFAERLTVSLLGDRENDLPNFRRERFEAWLSDQTGRGVPYDEIVRQAIASAGPATSVGATNFMTAEITQGEMHANRLARRTVRAFLGQSMDCAECHDHPFADWKQTDFEGLAAYYAQVRISSVGVEEDRDRQHEVEDRETLANRVVEPGVPFQDDWLGDGSSRRRQLAGWITHPENRRFRRAIVNRVWGLMFGRPFVTPVNDIPDPPPAGQSDETALLDVLGDDLQAHGYDLRRTALVIASSRPFRLGSTHSSLSVATADSEQAGSDCKRLTDSWAMFPLIHLRPEQLIRSLMQATSIQSMDGMDIVSRTQRQQRVRQFVEEHGSLGENEFDERSTTIPQTILRMHGRYTRETSNARAFSGSGRIAWLAASEANCLEACYLTCLTRRPTKSEEEHFLPQLAGSFGKRSGAVEDLFWTLLNSPEFVWNH